MIKFVKVQNNFSKRNFLIQKSIYCPTLKILKIRSAFSGTIQIIKEQQNKMKQILILICTTVFLKTYGQKMETVKMNWKIEENENLNYLTIMSDIDTTSIEMDFGGFFNTDMDSTNDEIKESRTLFKKLNEASKNLDYVTTLTNKNEGVIEILMRTKPKEKIEVKDIDSTYNKLEDAIQMIQFMSQGVMLRGSIYRTGGIHSFWVNNAQKNLISLFFELPTMPVKVGDKWSLDINLIANDQNFECDTSYKINEVTLTEIKKVDGDTIAVLKYNIIEYVKGKFNTPSFLDYDGGQKETMIKFNHQGIAEFSIGKGRWVQYDGLTVFESTGIMTAQKSTKYKLIEEINSNK